MPLHLSGFKTLGERLDALIPQIRHLDTYVDVHITIVGVQLLGEVVERQLIIKMHPLSKSMKTKLFEGYGPLRDYAAKVDVAFALKLFSEGAYVSLKAVGKVRDGFAHSTDYVNFTTPKIAKLVGNVPRLDRSIPDLRARFMHRISEIAAEAEGPNAVGLPTMLRDWRYSPPRGSDGGP